jgi:outer membrane lipoprotein
MHRVPWWKTWGCVGLFSMMVWGETGCIAVLSPQVRQQADRTLTFGQLSAMPEASIGRTVILGGEIVRIWNVPGVTFLDVLQRPLDAEDQPILTQPSEGRFIVRCDRYLNPLTYAAGRMVTVAGRVLGTHTETVGEGGTLNCAPSAHAVAGKRDTVYPLLACVEIYLWPQATLSEVYPSIWLWWEWDPWYGDPWMWRPHHHRLWRWRHHHPHRR